MKNISYNTCQKSAEEFIVKFKKFRNKKIVLYGIGQYTATLLAKQTNYNIIGLLDGDCDNVGKTIYGLRVMTVDEAQECADMIVINTSIMYWDLIFKRIANVNIPVYYPNGKRAVNNDAKRKVVIDNTVAVSSTQIKEAINDADIISFDIYDTLLMRIVDKPADVFKLLELKVEKRFGKKMPIHQIRNIAISKLNDINYELDDIYNEMKGMIELEILSEIKQMEIEIEQAVTIGRREMIALYNYAIELGKEVYVLTDMYLPVALIRDFLSTAGVEVGEEHIWVSGEKKVCKYDGSMWREYKKKIGNRKALHIGDSQKADIDEAMKEGILTIKILSPQEIMECYLIGSMEEKVSSLYASIIMGEIKGILCNNPFVINHQISNIIISDCYKFGELVFGSVILTFLLWVMCEAKEKGIEKLLFLSRDGYFLIRDYEKIINIICDDRLPQAEYVYASRKAVITMAANKKEAFEQLVEFYFKGKFKNYLFERFDIVVNSNDLNGEQECSLPEDSEKIKEWLKPYRANIDEVLSQFQRNYGEYLSQFKFDDKSALVDIGYAGRIQYWLSKIMNKELQGYYFFSDLSKNNIYNLKGKMKGCFQRKEDLSAMQSELWKRSKLVESFLTAPYGMLKTIDKEGAFTTYPIGNNQKYFFEREEINRGVIQFITKHVNLLKNMNLLINDISVDTIFVDELFGKWFETGIEFGDLIKKIFWHEDGFTNPEKEYRLME